MNENENSENLEPGSQSGSEDTQTETVTTVEVDYSEQLTAIYDVQCWSFGLLACFVGLFVSYILLSIISNKF